MLPSAFRLKRKSDFGRVYAKGRSYATDLVVVYALSVGGATSRIGFSVGSRLGGSVQRNRVKRLLREAARSLLPQLSEGYDIVVVARRRASEAGLRELGAALGGLLQKAGVLEAHGY